LLKIDRFGLIKNMSKSEQHTPEASDTGLRTTLLNLALAASIVAVGSTTLSSCNEAPASGDTGIQSTPTEVKPAASHEKKSVSDEAIEYIEANYQNVKATSEVGLEGAGNYVVVSTDGTNIETIGLPNNISAASGVFYFQGYTTTGARYFFVAK
jgi:predicted small secreted protein